MTLDDIRRLNIREAGNWPLLPKIMILGVLFFLIVLAGAFFDWRDQFEALDKAQDEEIKLRGICVQKSQGGQPRSLCAAAQGNRAIFRRAVEATAQ